MTGRFVDELNWHPMTAITGLRYSNTSELVAFSCDDLSIRVVDIETRKLVREFWGCVGQVNDFSFSPDGRWVIAASMDSLVRVWDLPTGHLIDVFRVPDTCTALTMSSTGEFLATAHADGKQVNLWSNRSLFMPVSTKNVDESTVADVSAPSMSGENGTAPVETAFSHEPEQDEEDGLAVISEQLGKDMLTLSAVPRSRWQTLLHLDLVKVRFLRFVYDFGLLTNTRSAIDPKSHRKLQKKRRFSFPRSLTIAKQVQALARRVLGAKTVPRSYYLKERRPSARGSIKCRMPDTRRLQSPPSLLSCNQASGPVILSRSLGI